MQGRFPIPLFRGANYQYWKVSSCESNKKNTRWEKCEISCQDLEKAGIRRTDKRLGRFMAALQQIVVEEGSKGQSVDNLDLNKEVYKRYIR